jgi:hypothetical protein
MLPLQFDDHVDAIVRLCWSKADRSIQRFFMSGKGLAEYAIVVDAPSSAIENGVDSAGHLTLPLNVGGWLDLGKLRRARPFSRGAMGPLPQIASEPHFDVLELCNGQCLFQTGNYGPGSMRVSTTIGAFTR